MGGFYGAAVSNDDDPEVQNLLAQLQEESLLQLSVGTHTKAGLQADEDAMEGLDVNLLERFAKLKSNPSGKAKASPSEGKDAALEQETKSRDASIAELDDRLARLKLAPTQQAKSAASSSGSPTSQRFSPMKLIKQLSMGKKSSSSKVKVKPEAEGGDTSSQSDASKLLVAVIDEVKLEKQQKKKNPKKAALAEEDEDVNLDLELKDLDVKKLKRELSKASVEEEKLAREAQKVLEWAKDAARLDPTPDSGDEDELLVEDEDEDENGEDEEDEHKSKSSKKEKKKKGKKWSLF